MYHDKGYDYGKGVVLNTLEHLLSLLPKGLPQLFFIQYNYKVCCLNLNND